MTAFGQRQFVMWQRAIVTMFIVTTIVAFSWGLAGFHLATATPDITQVYFADAISRRAASTDELIEQLQARLLVAPNDWPAYSQLGLVYLQKARETGDPTYYQKVEGVLDEALALEPDDYTAVGAKGALALARHQFQEALAWGQRARQLNPDRTYAYGVIADAQIELGQYEEAVATLQKMINLRPDPSSYSRISYLRELYGDTTGALVMMQQAVDGGTLNTENTAWTRTQLANLYFNLGNLEQAEVEYQRTLQNYPNYVYALAGLGRLRAALGQTDEAIALLTQASQITPLPEFVITLGDLYLALGQTEAAQQQYDLVGAIRQLHQANGVDLDVEMALFDADHRRNPVETVAQARQAYARRPSIHAADVLAWALYQAGDYQEAEKFSRQALRLGTKDALKLFHAGMIAYQLGHKLQARDYLDQALAINPHFSLLHVEEARRIREELK